MFPILFPLTWTWTQIWHGHGHGNEQGDGKRYGHFNGNGHGQGHLAYMVHHLQYIGMSAMYLPSPWRKKFHKDKIFQDPVKCKKQLPGDAKKLPHLFINRPGSWKSPRKTSQCIHHGVILRIFKSVQLSLKGQSFSKLVVSYFNYQMTRDLCLKKIP